MNIDFLKLIFLWISLALLFEGFFRLLRGWLPGGSKFPLLKLYWVFLLALVSAPIVNIGLPSCSTEALFSGCLVAVIHLALATYVGPGPCSHSSAPDLNPKHWRGL